ncbi:hypothetical protein FACS189426_02120 [Bacteroidia bacterium]|nr:hypothetical protein FACS189426_02120 [Bacteroidia bacterium]GHV70390.1 hypothetical protein FACS189420_1300 [Bacteroidia bacterium]
MKRLISIFTLAILLLTAVQPTLVFHYCGGSLHSVGWVNNELPKSCCGGEHKNCCSNETLKIATDDFQLQQQDLTAFAQLVLNPVLFVLSENLFLSESSGALVLQNIFPPGGLAKYNTAIIHLNCVYRI